MKTVTKNGVYMDKVQKLLSFNFLDLPLKLAHGEGEVWVNGKGKTCATGRKSKFYGSVTWEAVTEWSAS